MSILKTTVLFLVLTVFLVALGGMVGGPGGAVGAFVVALVMNFITYWYSDRIVLGMYRPKELPREGYEHIYEIVDEVSKKAAIPAPKVYVVKQPVPNAFATGRNPAKGVICLTTGIFNLLDREELKGVISHEVAHIRNRDTLIMAVAAAFASAVMMLVHLARWGAAFGGMSREKRDNRNISGVLALSVLAPLGAMLVQMAISRMREYDADAEGARFTGSGNGLACALEKLGVYSEKDSSFSPPPETSHMFIVKPSAKDALVNLFSTHPPIGERIRRLRGSL